MLPRPPDTTIAHKTINLMPELSGTDKRIAGAIIDHFNRQTGQCDPSLERIAWLVGLSRRTVIRSLSRVESTGILRKVRHGGHLQRNSYEPVWERFRELEAAWKARFNAKSRRAAPAKMSPATCQTSPFAGDQPVTQTFLSNQSKETCPGERSRTPSKDSESKRLPMEEKKEAVRSSLVVTARETRTTRSSDAARVAAERRWNTALNHRYAGMPTAYAQIIEAIDPALQNTATEAEIRRAGAGLALIVERLPTLVMRVTFRDGAKR